MAAITEYWRVVLLWNIYQFERCVIIVEEVVTFNTT